MLQRFCDQLEYSELLDKANASDNPGISISYVAAFIFSLLSSTIERMKKPFNPLLGETYELVSEEKQFRFVSEQVSHHPPISAGYAESPNFKLWSNTNVKTSFWGKFIDIKPLGAVHVVLPRMNHHFIIDKNKTIVQNIIIGTMYVDHYDNITVKNVVTGDQAIITMKQRGWGGKNAYQASGVMKDKDGKEKFKMKGSWDKELWLLDSSNGEKILQLWERKPLRPDSHFYYFYSDFCMQLNYLNLGNLKYIAPTDSRLRPDQLALEHGFREMAVYEKNRLEEKQRARRKLFEAQKRVHQPKWFTEAVNSITGEKEYEYIGGYWEAREKQEFGDLLDIY